MQGFQALLLFMSISLTIGVAGACKDPGNIFASCLNMFKSKEGDMFKSKGEGENEPEPDGVISWKADSYKVNRRQYKKEDGECIEEIKIKWNGVAHPVTFNPKCLEDGSFRVAYHDQNQVLIIGNLSEDFFVFSTTERKYICKENGKWIRGSQPKDDRDPIQTQIEEEDEIEEIMTAYTDYHTNMQMYKYNIGIFEEQKRDREKRHSEVLERIAKDKEQEEKNYQEFTEKQNNRDNGEKIKSFFKGGSGSSKVQTEHDLKMKKLEDEFATENNKYTKEIKEITQKIADENKHLEETFKNLATKC